jgi:predicted phosphodiesterase
VKIAVLADVHANLEALEAVLIDVDKAGVDRIICLGDVVGYGVDPVACINRLREVDADCVLGNHDQATIDPAQLKTLNPLAREVILRSRDLLGETERDYLQTFAFRRVECGGVFAHANPLRPEDWAHVYLYNEVVWCMQRMDWRLGFIGHTHHQAIHCKIGEQVVSLTSAKVAVNRHQCLINPGSVGQPRDGDWRAAYAIWEVEAKLVELQRVEYPVEVTRKKMLQAGWPDYLAQRLGMGE